MSQLKGPECQKERKEEKKAGFLILRRLGIAFTIVSHFVFVVWFFLKDFIYLFMRDTQREAETGRGRSGFLAGSLIRDTIPRPGIRT